jgi:hypothetical protein
MRERKDLRPAQIKIVRELVQSTGVQVVLGMGGGKTVATLTAIVDLIDAGTIDAAIIAAPVRVAIHTWPNEIRSWEHTVDLDFVVLSGTPEQRLKKLKEKHQIYLCSVDNLVWLVDALRKFPKTDPRWGLLVVDELSRMKNPRGQRAKKLKRFSDRFGAIWGLTGTPRPSGWEDQWMPLQIVSAGTAWGESFDDWRKRYFVQLDFNGYNWEVRTDSVPKIKSVVDEWSFTIAPEEATDIPFNYGAEFDTMVSLSSTQIADLKSLEDDLFVELGGGDVERLRDPDDDIVVAMSSAVASGKMSQIIQGFLYDEGQTLQTYKNAKLDALTDILEANNGEPVLIVYYYKQDLVDIRKRCGDIPNIGSDTSEKDFLRHIEAWNRGDVPVMAVHPASIGHGVDGMQHGGRRMVWYSMTWSGELFAQMCKRLARPGQKLPVYVHRILGDHWLEKLRVQRVERKMAEEQDFIKTLRRLE